jgi:hypothetical protein
MSTFRKITARDKPEGLARIAAEHEQHLRLALTIAVARSKRSSPLIQELLSKATVEGLGSRLNVKAAVVSFRVPHLKQTWHQIIPWQNFKGARPAVTATHIASGLRESVRRSESKMAPDRVAKANDRSDA